MNSLTAKPISIGEQDVYQYTRQDTDDGVKHQIPLSPRHAFTSGDLQRSPICDCKSSTIAALGLEKIQFHRYSDLRAIYFARKRPLSSARPLAPIYEEAIFPYSTLAMPASTEGDASYWNGTYVPETYPTQPERPLSFDELFERGMPRRIYYGPTGVSQNPSCTGLASYWTGFF